MWHCLRLQCTTYITLSPQKTENRKIRNNGEMQLLERETQSCNMKIFKLNFIRIVNVRNEECLYS